MEGTEKQRSGASPSTGAAVLFQGRDRGGSGGPGTLSSAAGLILGYRWRIGGIQGNEGTVALRRVPLAVSLPVVVAAFSAGVAASLWQDHAEPVQAVTAPGAVPTTVPPVAVEPTASAPTVAEPKTAPSPESDMRAEPAPRTLRPADSAAGKAEASGRAQRASYGPQSQAGGKPDAAARDAAGDDAEEARPDAGPAPATGAKEAPTHPAADTVSRPPVPAVDVQVPPTTYALPVAPPEELRPPSARRPPPRQAAAKVTRKAPPKQTEVPILGPLFGLKY
ncbi:MAG: hypothetical protein NW223_11125 [Hyphomicrobiaceae bacterium]|nr:hypothetical protein [Hyphomicrobiaceae bacterium]